MDSDILGYYNNGREHSRLKNIGRLEFVRTQELLHRFMPPAPAEVIDIGGGAGIHALPLMEDGFSVTLVEPVPLHVDQAREASIANATVGDARHLSFEDESFDVALLLGPLYHLTEREDRLTALRGALRLVRPGGLLFAAVISRFASTHDGLQMHFLTNPEFERIVEDDVAMGQHRNPTRRSGWFTTAYLHRPEEIGEELVEAGWEPKAVLAIEGAGSSCDSDYWLDDPERQEIALRAIRRVEAEPSLLGSSPHVLAIGTRP